MSAAAGGAGGPAGVGGHGGGAVGHHGDVGLPLSPDVMAAAANRSATLPSPYRLVYSNGTRICWKIWTAFALNGPSFARFHCDTKDEQISIPISHCFYTETFWLIVGSSQRIFIYENSPILPLKVSEIW